MSSILQRDFRQLMPVVVRGDGVFVVDDAGKHYLDACGGAAVSCLGHDAREITDAISDQLRTLAFAHSSFFTNAAAEQLAARLIALAPDGFGAGRVMFLGSGSEAIEAALKLARQYHLERGDTKRTHFIARDGAYHGNTLGALAAGGHVERRRPYEPMLVEFGRASACYAYRLQQPGESDDAFGQRQAQTLEDEILRIGPQRVAAFVVEPVTGATLGCVPPVGRYLEQVREICDRYGVLIIADEVMCGAGRTGPYFASSAEGLRPDIITLAKGLGAGFMPIAATLGSAKVVEAIAAGSGRLWNGHTYMSHAVACAGALAVLDIVERDGLLERVSALGEGLRARLVARFGDHPFVGDIRGRGLFHALEFVIDRDTKRPFAPAAAFATKLKQAAMAEGLLIYPASGCIDGINGDHVVIAPPYVVSEKHLDLIVDRLALAIHATAGNARGAA
jgi:adenosylmethionine-8-amino-7-oxononanoate aminotransferase